MNSPYKAYVSVDATFTKEGLLIPHSILWEDGRRYEIDKVKSIQRAAATGTGGCGIRYVCTIRGRDIDLFYEENYQWFLQRLIPNGRVRKSDNI